MEEIMLTSMAIGLIIGALIGGVVLMLLAKYIGKIESANYKNSFIICLLSSGINYIIWYIIGVEAYTMGFGAVFGLSFVILASLYIIIGKTIWKTTWIQSIKANAIWILLFALMMGYSFNAQI